MKTQARQNIFTLASLTAYALAVGMIAATITWHLHDVRFNHQEKTANVR